MESKKEHLIQNPTEKGGNDETGSSNEEMGPTPVPQFTLYSYRWIIQFAFSCAMASS